MCADVVEGSTRIAANGVRRASFIRCFQVTFSGWAEILLKAELSKPHGPLDSSLTKLTGDRGTVLFAAAQQNWESRRGVGTDGSQRGLRPHQIQPWGFGDRAGIATQAVVFQLLTTIESIADRLVFNRTLRGNFCAVAGTSKKEPQALGGWTAAWGSRQAFATQYKEHPPSQRKHVSAEHSTTH
jgi:hypothetical protein